MQLRARDVARVTGLSYRQIDYCLRSGVLRPVSDSRGSGLPREFGLRGLLALSLLREVLRAGIPARVVGPALRLVQRGSGLPSLARLGGAVIWTDGHKAVLVREGRVDSSLPGTITYALNVGAVTARLRTRLEKNNTA